MRRWKSVLAVDSTHLFPAVSEAFIISLLTGKRASHRHLLEDISIDIGRIFIGWLTLLLAVGGQQHRPSGGRSPSCPPPMAPGHLGRLHHGRQRVVEPPASPSPAVAGRVDLPQCRPLSARIHVQSRYAGCGLGRIVYHRVHMWWVVLSSGPATVWPQRVRLAWPSCRSQALLIFVNGCPLFCLAEGGNPTKAIEVVVCNYYHSSCHLLLLSQLLKTQWITFVFEENASSDLPKCVCICMNYSWSSLTYRRCEYL